MVLKYTAICNETIFSKADNYMNKGCFQSFFPFGNINIYIGDLKLRKSLILLYILSKNEAATFSGIQLT